MHTPECPLVDEPAPVGYRTALSRQLLADSSERSVSQPRICTVVSQATAVVSLSLCKTLHAGSWKSLLNLEKLRLANQPPFLKSSMTADGTPVAPLDSEFACFVSLKCSLGESPGWPLAPGMILLV